jgi:1-aminocyclopropane-1-carboxylate deaminase/D-cysteine desulfhydrase-like pyridoxal-dependent ACC family enzyme
VALGQFPTALEAAPRLSAEPGFPPVWIKREDQSGLALGGNKPRQLEFLMAAAMAEGAQAVVTTAAAQSNFCRATAAAGARLGIRVGLLLRGTGEEALQGNLLLDRLFGAELRFIPTLDPYDPRVPGWIDAFVADFTRQGLKTHVLHLPGRTGTLGAAAMVTPVRKWRASAAAQGIAPQAVFLAAGSGLTVAGLVLAFKALGLATRVVGISVQKPAAFIVPLIVERANAARSLLGLSTRVDAGDFDFDDRHIGTGYGVPTQGSVDAIQFAGSREGLVLDPVYSGKAFAGMLAQLRAGRWPGDAPVVFFHSGGAPGLFAPMPRSWRSGCTDTVCNCHDGSDHFGCPRDPAHGADAGRHTHLARRRLVRCRSCWSRSARRMVLRVMANAWDGSARAPMPSSSTRCLHRAAGTKRLRHPPPVAADARLPDRAGRGHAGRGDRRCRHRAVGRGWQGARASRCTACWAAKGARRSTVTPRRSTGPVSDVMEAQALRW